MKKALTIVAASALALTATACGKSADTSSANVSSEDNMLVPADENGMGGDMNSGMATDNAMGGDNMMSDNSMAAGNSSNAM